MEFDLRESEDLSEGKREGKLLEQKKRGRSKLREPHEQENRGLPSRVVMQHAPSPEQTLEEVRIQLPSYTTKEDTANFISSKSSSQDGDSSIFVN